MSKWLGNFAEDATLDFKFSTVDATGAPTTLAGTPALSVYKANGATQSTAGITLSVDFDSVTGLNHVRIDLSADAFYATGNDYDVVITTGTVDGASVVGYVVASFSIENRYNEVNVTAITDGLLTAAKFGSNAITADKIADGALTAAKFAAGAFDAVWSVATRSLTTFGTLVSDVATAVWGAGTRTLSAFAFTPSLHEDYDAAKTAAQAGDAMTLTSGERSTLAAAIEAAILDEGDATALLAAIAAKVEEFLINDGDATATLAAIATAIRTELAVELARIDAAISTRLASGSYSAPLDAAGVRDAVGLASGNLDTQLGDIPTNAELTAALGTLNDPNVAAIVAGIMAAAVDGSITVADALKRIHAVAANKRTAAGDSSIVETFRNAADDADVLILTHASDGTSRTVS